MTPCGQSAAIAPAERRARTHEVIGGLFAAGKAEAAFKHRLSQCCHASDCGRLCRRLIKGPGVSQVRCNINYGDDGQPALADLYESLKDPAFKCPEGLF